MLFDDYSITFDVDWAPDWCISDIANTLINEKINATWFITHESKAIDELFDHPDLFEIGIHPNFLDGSTQGKNPFEIMEYLLNIVPNAISVRTHLLTQSYSLLKMIREDFGIKCDVSLLLPGASNLTPHEICYSKGKSLVRIPFFWEDDIEMNNSAPSFLIENEKFHVNGLKIFDFHPIHIYLNSYSCQPYRVLKKHINPLSKISLETVNSHIHNGEGSGKLFLNLIKYLKTRNIKSTKIVDLYNRWEQLK